jgi:hypothetical protein
MAGPLGGTTVCPVPSTIKVEEDVDGRPPRGALPAGLTASTIEVEEDVDDEPLVGGVPVGPTASTTKVEDDRVSIPPCVQSSCKVKHGKR